MPESIYDVIQLIGTSNESWEKAAANAVEQPPNLSAMFASQKSSNSICNWTRRERSKHIARRSSYRSNSRALQRLDCARVYCAIAPCCLLHIRSTPIASPTPDTLQREAIML